MLEIHAVTSPEAMEEQDWLLQLTAHQPQERAEAGVERHTWVLGSRPLWADLEALEAEALEAQVQPVMGQTAPSIQAGAEAELLLTPYMATGMGVRVGRAL